MARLSGITKRTTDGRIAKGSNLTHGLSDDPIYDCWVAMKARCNNPKHPMFKYYGGRGIKVSSRWQKSFGDFYEDMGPKPSPAHTLDRINNNGNYEPLNCRWITIQEQQKNRRNNVEYVGVAIDPKYKHSVKKKWRAEITRAGKKLYLGLFDDPVIAYGARIEAERRLDG